MPKQIVLNEILEQVALFANKLEIKLLSFVPSDEKSSEQDLDYRELPIKIEVEAPFRQIMLLLDELVHLNIVTHIRDVQFRAKPKTKINKEQQEEQMQMLPQEDIIAGISLILFESI